jgi:ubiquinol-cytochrome c reductase iron-sulfur subunit
MVDTVEAAQELSRQDEGTRRDFLYLTTGATAAVGIAAMIWPLIDNMNPAADVLALSAVEVDLEGIELGQRITAKWRGRPVFIVHRTEQQIDQARADDQAGLIDPQPDSARVIEPEWLIVVGVCTHLGCIPLGQKEGDPLGKYGGWFCPCHGSLYDISGRVRRGPAPENLVVPEYAFLDESRVRIG